MIKTRCFTILFGLGLLLGFSGCSALQLTDQSLQIREIAGKIASFSLPLGYREQMAADVLGYQIVSLTGPTPACHIYLIQAPRDAEIDVDALQAQARAMEGNSDTSRPRDVRNVDQRPIQVRGQAVILLVGEGVNSDGLPYRQASVVFAGKNGPAMVNISAPTERWDWNLVNGFLTSIQ